MSFIDLDKLLLLIGAMTLERKRVLTRSLYGGV